MGSLERLEQACGVVRQCFGRLLLVAVGCVEAGLGERASIQGVAV